MSIYLGTSPIAVSSPSRNIGQIIQSTIPLTDAGLHLLDGSLISGSGSYSAFVTYIASLVSSYPDLFETEANWQNAVITYGVCGKFVYDSVNNTVRLPRITGFTEGTIDPTVLGDLVEAGLPNITGELGNFDTWGYGNNAIRMANGAFSFSGSRTNNGKAVKTETNSAGEDYRSADFDASRSNSIYGNSDTVQPQSIKVLYYIVIANSVKTNIEVDIDEIATDLNGKADVDLTNVNSSGTSLASGWSMPSSRYVDLTLGASGTQYIAPANGVFIFSKRGNAAGQWMVASCGVQRQCYTASSNGAETTIYMFAKKGDVLLLEYNVGGDNVFSRFIYAEGDN